MLNAGFSNSSIPKNKGKQLLNKATMAPKGKRKRSAQYDGLSRKESKSNFKKGMYLAYIEEAFTSHEANNDTNYNELVSQFKEFKSAEQIELWLDALTHFVSKLTTQRYASLVETILAMPWAISDNSSFVTTYIKFTASLASARQEWLRDVLQTCVRGWRYKSSFTLALLRSDAVGESKASLGTLSTSSQGNPISARSKADPQLASLSASLAASLGTLGAPAGARSGITRRTVFARIHSLVKILSSLIPTLAVNLWPLLSKNFPSKRDHKTAHVCYVDNLLQLSQYIPGMAEDILGLIVEKALLLDVEIQTDPEEYEDDDGEPTQSMDDVLVTARDILDRPAAENLDVSSDEESDEDDEFDFSDLDSEIDPESDSEAQKRAAQEKIMTTTSLRKLLEKRDKLDVILKVIFDHLAASHATSHPTASHSNNNMFENHVAGGVGVSSAASVVGILGEGGRSSQNGTTLSSIAPGGIAPGGVLASALASGTASSIGAFSAEIPQAHVAPPASETAPNTFKMLLDVFDRVLLKTFKPRCTQFILFYLCSLNHDWTDHFIGVLLGRALLQVHTPLVTRVAAAGYLASFVSRATFVSADATRTVVGMLCEYLEAQTGAGRREELPVVYAVCQALFYVFCFRWRDLLSEPVEGEDSMALSLSLESDPEVLGGGLMASRWTPHGLDATVQKLLTSTLNPLKHCSQSVVRQFATVAQKVNFVYCFSIIESNGRANQSGAQNGSQTDPHHSILDSFFPFDPLKLPLSRAYIDGIYRTWEEVGESDVESESESDVDSDAEIDVPSGHMHPPPPHPSPSFASFSLPRSPNSPLSPPSSASQTRRIKLRKTGNGRIVATREDEELMSKSFEAMSLSPEHWRRYP